MTVPYDIYCKYENTAQTFSLVFCIDQAAPIVSWIVVPFSRFKLDIRKKMFYCESGEALA